MRGAAGAPLKRRLTDVECADRYDQCSALIENEFRAGDHTDVRVCPFGQCRVGEEALLLYLENAVNMPMGELCARMKVVFGAGSDARIQRGAGKEQRVVLIIPRWVDNSDEDAGYPPPPAAASDLQQPPSAVRMMFLAMVAFALSLLLVYRYTVGVTGFESNGDKK